MTWLGARWSWVQRHARGIALGVWLVCLSLCMLALTLNGLILLGRAPGGRLDALDLYYEPGMFVLATCGALIVARWPAQVMGWLFCLSGLLGLLNWLGAAYEQFAGTEPLPLMAWVLWLATAGDFAHILILILIVPQLFPNGRPLSRRWRPLLLSVGLIVFVAVHDALGASEVGFDDRRRDANPFHLPVELPSLAPLEPLVFVSMGVALLGAVVSLVLRGRRAHGMERLQIRWLLWTVGLLIGLALMLLLGTYSWPAIFNLDNNIWTLPEVALGMTILIGISFGIPLVLGLSILRYRLYSLDLVIHRMLVYGALTTCVVGLYVLIAGYLGSLFRTSNNLAISLVATAVVAVLFQPLRERIQRGANRLLYGERDEPYAVISRLGRRLEETLAPDAVLPAIVATVREALKLPYVAVALWQGEQLVTAAAAAGTAVREPLRLPLVYQQEPVGELHLAPRAPGEPFDRADRRLLDDLARQAGVAAHAVRLTADLQRSRERLVAAREEERRRLRRDLHDGLGPMLGSLTLKLDVADDRVERDPAAARALLRDLKSQAQTAIVDIRQLVYALRPPALDDLGLAGALRAEATQYEGSSLRIVVEAPATLPPLPAAVEVAAYRIAQEALTNVVRHAGARTCTIRLVVADDALDLEVTDDGLGLPTVHRQGVGLVSMRERATELGGACGVEFLSGGGTRVRASFPLTGVAADTALTAPALVGPEV
jgi:signal transduction histidine kinase